MTHENAIDLLDQADTHKAGIQSLRLVAELSGSAEPIPPGIIGADALFVLKRMGWTKAKHSERLIPSNILLAHILANDNRERMAADRKAAGMLETISPMSKAGFIEALTLIDACWTHVWCFDNGLL